MLKTACLLTGENYSLLSTETPASKKKVVAMSIAMLVPTLIWILNGFVLSFMVLKTGLGWSIMTALICGLIIFFIEKLIIMANGNKWLTFFRVSIGLIIAILGSIAIDEVVFMEDINISASHIKEDVVNDAKVRAEGIFNKLNHIGEINENIKIAQVKYDNADLKAVAESDGTQGTGHRGVGDVAKFKDQKAKERKRELKGLLAAKHSLLLKKDSCINEAGMIAAASFHENALLTRIKALFTLISSDMYMLINYLLFTMLVFFFEFIVVILKLTWKKTNYENRVELIEEIGRRRMDYLQKPDSLLLDPGYYLPRFENTQAMANQAPSLFR